MNDQSELAPICDAALDDMRQEDCDRAQKAFEHWATRVEKNDTLNRLEACRGWHAGVEYQERLNRMEIAALTSSVAELERENKRLWTLIQCGQA